MSGCKWQYVSGLTTSRAAPATRPTTYLQNQKVVALGNLPGLDTGNAWPVLGAFGIAVVLGAMFSVVVSIAKP